MHHYSLAAAEALNHINLDLSSINAVAIYLRQIILQAAAVSKGLPDNLLASVRNEGDDVCP